MSFVPLTAEHLATLKCDRVQRVVVMFAATIRACAAELNISHDMLIDDKGADGVFVHPALLAKLLADPTAAPAAAAAAPTTDMAVVERVDTQLVALTKDLAAVNKQLVAMAEQSVAMKKAMDVMKKEQAELRLQHACESETTQQLVKEHGKRVFDKVIEVDDFMEQRRLDDLAAVRSVIEERGMGQQRLLYNVLDAIAGAPKRKLAEAQLAAGVTAHHAQNGALGALVSHRAYMARKGIAELTEQQTDLLIADLHAEHFAKRSAVKRDEVGPFELAVEHVKEVNAAGNRTRRTVLLYEIDTDVFERVFDNPARYGVKAKPKRQSAIEEEEDDDDDDEDSDDNLPQRVDQAKRDSGRDKYYQESAAKRARVKQPQ
jgi:hypothetical protein